VKALIIEDDREIVESVKMAFAVGWPEGEVVAAHLGRKGVEMAESEWPDVVIIDLGLPDISGYEVLRRVRAFSSVPIIILTVRGDEESIVRGLESGADDYVVKPCGQLELLARIRARLRDRGGRKGMPVSFGALRFDPQTWQLRNGKAEMSVTAIEGLIIQELLRNGERVSTHARLTEAVWGADYPGSIDSLRVHIRRLREKIEEEPSRPRIIMTKAGVGYFLSRRPESERAEQPDA
jgi:DNA-binding response OmpR family regulator